MKRAILVLAIMMTGLFYVADNTAEAVKPTMAERFSESAGAQTKGVSGKYIFDRNHTAIGFKVKHLGLIKIPGYFRDFTGEIDYNAQDVTKSAVSFTAKVDSVDTGAVNRDAHLKRDDFFDAEKFPNITFKSTKVEKRGDDYYLTGDLTIRDVTKSITFEFDIEGFLPGNQRNGGTIGVSADTKIKRFDYGVDYGKNAPAGTPGVANEVEIELAIEANLPKPPASGN